MRKFNALVFDEYVAASQTQPVYTSATLNERLGAYDKLGLMMVCDNLSATPSVSVQINVSSDQRAWANKNGSAEIPSTQVAAGTAYYGADTSTGASLGFVRLAVNVTGASAGAHVRIWVTARDPQQ